MNHRDSPASWVGGIAGGVSGAGCERPVMQHQSSFNKYAPEVHPEVPQITCRRSQQQVPHSPDLETIQMLPSEPASTWCVPT